MRWGSFRLRGAVLCAAALVACGAAKAETLDTTFDTLIPGGSNEAGIVLGDKRYSHFSFVSPATRRPR
jgi:hypothetical protein